MRASQPQSIYLKDYRKPPFLIDHVDLRFELFEDQTRFTPVSRSAVTRKPMARNATWCCTGKPGA